MPDPRAAVGRMVSSTPAPGSAPRRSTTPSPVLARQRERILVVEDEAGMVLALEDALESEGYEVAVATDGIAGQDAAVASACALVILDVMLPGRDGFQVCQNVRAAGSNVPILMLTARSTTIDTVMGLRLGADDFLTKPFDMQVLLARVHALLRRSRDESGRPAPHREEQSATVARFGRFAFDQRTLQLFRGTEEIPLNAQELRLLQVFLRNPNRPLSRELLLNEAWGYEVTTSTRTVDVHVSWLRRKLGESEAPRHLITLRGYGYRFVP